jgi:hypothetical protein
MSRLDLLKTRLREALEKYPLSTVGMGWKKSRLDKFIRDRQLKGLVLIKKTKPFLEVKKWYLFTLLFLVLALIFYAIQLWLYVIFIIIAVYFLWRATWPKN